MTEFDELRRKILELPPKRLALLALSLQEELERERSAARQPIAVVGMACRFPGAADSIAGYWRVLEQGIDAINEVPPDRWSVDQLYDPDPDAVGRVATKWGGFLTDVQGFDAPFFAISPREAQAMDPQQRLLMELSWRALEDSGIPPTRLFGTRTGVFVGLCNNDYLTRLLKAGTDDIDAYYSSGNAYSVAAGRISFTFGFQGPAVTVDTACSSSLVALHEACQSLRSGESDAVLAGGANVMCSPETTMALSRSRMMAPDGRCKTFDDAADGFVRGEGCGVLVLKRLCDATRDGDRIHAVLRGSATGQDGRSTGLTVPNGPAQEQVIRDALERAGLTPSDIDYIEAHGTGTSLGDPIEVRALGRVFGKSRDTPLYIGSVKTNMGHLESAAGIAGVIKAVLAVREGRIPPHLHFTNPSRHIDWDEAAIEVPADGRAWPETGRPRRAGVSSFGFSGTNAHVIVEQAPEPARRTLSGAPELPFELLTISGFTPDAREGIAAAYHDALSDLDAEQFRAFSHTARTGRTAFGWRRALVAANADEARASLAGAADAPAVIEGHGKVADPPPLAFLFTGQGAQSPGMGRALYEHAPVFRAAIDRCAAILDPLLPVPLCTALFEDSDADGPLYRTTVAQPAVVAFEWSLAELWRSWGVQPSAVMGHSLGEFVAACVAGVFTLEDMLRLVAERGRLLDSLPRGDRMAALFAHADVVHELLAGHEDLAAVAAYNGPESTVVSGRADVVAAIVEACAKRGIESRELRLDRGFHSPRVEPILDDLQRCAAAIRHASPQLPVAWNVTGEVGGAAPPPAGYWREHARKPVRFMQGVKGVAALGIRHFLEIGPHPTLSPLVAQILEDDELVLVPTLRRGGDACRDALEALGQLWVAGVDVDLQALDQSAARGRMDIPGHPFARERYWVDPPGMQRTAAPRGALPGIRIETAAPIFETVFTATAPAFLAYHRFRGEPVVPGPVYVAAAREAARRIGHRTSAVADLQLLAPAIVGSAGLRLQTIIEQGDTQLRFRVLSLPVDADQGAQWTEHARGVLLDAPRSNAPVLEALDGNAEPVSAAAHLERLRALGFDLGAAAAPWSDLMVGTQGARAHVVSMPDDDTLFTAALRLDAAIQVLGAALARGAELEPRMLAGIDEVVWAGDVGAATTYAVVPAPDAAAGGDAVLLDANEQPVAWLRGIRLGSVPAATDARGWHHSVEWQPAPADAPEPAFTDDATRDAGRHVQAAWLRIAADTDLAGCVASMPDLNRRAVAFIRQAFAQLSRAAVGDRFDASDAAHRLGIVPAHHRLLSRLLDILSEDGLLAHDDTGYRLLRDPSATEQSEMREGATDDPLDALVNRCGASLADVLTGRVDPLDLLFPDGDREATRAIYRDTAFGRAYNDALRVALHNLAVTHHTRPLRILEAGAGSGSTTLAALDALHGRSFHYTFTDIAPTLVHTAQDEFSDRDEMEFRTLDLEMDPAAQGVAYGSQDVIIAANVVHATERVDTTLAHLGRMLAPGGVLILLEATHATPWVDITFGLTAGWWRFQDEDVRPSYPLLSREDWTRAMAATGFTNVRAIPAGALAESAGQVILLGSKPARPAVAAIQSGSPLALALEGERSVAASIDVRGIVFDGRDAFADHLLTAMQRVIADPDAQQLWIVTERAQSIDAYATTRESDRSDAGSDARADGATIGDAAIRPEQAILWGLARGFALEHPERWGGIIDVDAGMTDGDVARVVLDEMRRGGVEDQVMWRGGERYVPRIIAAPTPADVMVTIEPATYLVTGGLGGLGLEVARWLADRGAVRLVLVGRSARLDDLDADHPARLQIDALERDGVTVMVRAVDVTDPAALDALLAEVRLNGAPLHGVVHAAAAFDAASIRDLTSDRLATVLAPKVAGTMALLDATAPDPLDFMVLFSSTTSLLGVAGLASYAAANQYLDAFAVQSRARGRPVVSIDWGIWQQMRLASQDEQTRYAQAGLRPMPSDAALNAMGRVLAQGSANAIIASIDWERLRAVYEARRSRPLLHKLDVPASHESVAPESGTARGQFETLAAIPLEERRVELLKLVENEVRQVLRLADNRLLDPAEGFFAMGMDSLMSVELKSRLEARLGTKLPATLTFNYPSTEAVAGFIEIRIDQAAQALAQTARQETSASQIAAIVATPALSGPGIDEDRHADGDADHEADAVDADDADETTLAQLLERRLDRLERKSSSP